ENSGIVSGVESCDDGRLEIVAGREPRSCDLLLLGGFPAVICDRGKASRTVQSKGGVSQSRQTKLGERRALGANEDPFGRDAFDNESADADPVSGQDVHSGGKIQGLSGRRRAGFDSNRSVWTKRVGPFRVGVNRGA